jgi:hypothetical protein
MCREASDRGRDRREETKKAAAPLERRRLAILAERTQRCRAGVFFFALALRALLF